MILLLRGTLDNAAMRRCGACRWGPKPRQLADYEIPDTLAASECALLDPSRLMQAHAPPPDAVRAAGADFLPAVRVASGVASFGSLPVQMLQPRRAGGRLHRGPISRDGFRISGPGSRASGTATGEYRIC